MFGPVGMNKGMATLMGAAGTCWDWSFLASHPPTVAHVQAFTRVADLLKPFLRFSYFPDQKEFKHVAGHSFGSLT